jgi:hypothetical protein
MQDCENNEISKYFYNNQAYGLVQKIIPKLKFIQRGTQHMGRQFCKGK